MYLLQTIERYKEVKQTTSTMVKSGNLARSIHFKSDGKGVTVFSTNRYSQVHQQGIRPNAGGFLIKAKWGVMHIKTPNGWRTVKQFVIPQRRFLGISGSDRAFIMKTVRKYLDVQFPPESTESYLARISQRAPIAFPGGSNALW